MKKPPFILSTDPLVELYLDIKPTDDPKKLHARIVLISDEEIKLVFTHEDCISNVRSETREIDTYLAYIIDFDCNYAKDGLVEINLGNAPDKSAFMSWNRFGSVGDFFGKSVYGKTSTDSLTKEALIRSQLLLFTTLYLDKKSRITD